MVRRRDGWSCADTRIGAPDGSARYGSIEAPERVRWLRSYVFRDNSGALGAMCVFEATSEEAIRKHAARVNIPADEIIEIMETIVIRPEPDATGSPG